MKRIYSIIFCLSILFTGSLSLVNSAHADEIKMVGVITKIEMAADGKSATAILKDNKTSENVPISITDDLTLDKFKDHRIVEGDEIRCKFEKENNKNNSKLFKKTAGC
ncbi:MAG: hypothetical protein P4L44_12870 [Oryzomonas sp.]|uniref:hypothetical protein n=1 Tax=Oryzomonas sp. TaxID=2855186 RepID=UPI00284AD5DD|nr:hypothetical protein [Oryzomonas sp.]MDR3580846.1 hypothetical protein [Oryzomonas sp.]